MLKHKIKIDTSAKYDNIEMDDFYLSPDLEFISGTTSYKHELVSGSMVRYQLRSGTLFYESPLECSNVIRQGKVSYTGLFPLNRATYYGKDIAYVEYNGKVYYVNDGDIVVDFDDNTYIISGVTDSTEEVPIPVTSYIENGIANIDGNELSVDVSCVSGFSGMSDDANSPLFKYNYMSRDVDEYNEEPFEIDLWPHDQWKIVTKFILRPDDNILLDVSSRHIIRPHPYIRIGSETYSVQTDDEMSISGSTFIDVNAKRLDIPDVFSCNGVINVTGRTYVELWDGSHVELESYNEEAENGDMVAIVMSNPHDTLDIGSTVIAKSIYNDYLYVNVETDYESGEEYVMFGNLKYDIIKDDYITVTINGTEYEFIYVNEVNGQSYGVIEMGEHVVPLRINFDTETAYRIDAVSVLYGESGPVEYGITRYDSVVIDGEKYRVDRTSRRGGSITLTKPQNYEFTVVSLSGSGVYYLYPNMTTNNLSPGDTEKSRIRICGEVGGRDSNYVFYLKNTAFGNEKITFKKVFDDQMQDNPGMTPISSDDIVSPNTYEGTFYSEPFKDRFVMYKIEDYYSIPIVLSSVYGSNLMQEDMMVHGKLKNRIVESISPLVDMEKDVYFPCLAAFDEGGKYDESNSKVAKKLEFNIHLRSRDLDTWTVKESDENPFFSNESNWNVTDCGAYKNIIDGDDEDLKKKLMRSSDLLYFLKFSDDDVERQKKKIEKTFLRLSFYNSPDAANQYLLATSTIFLDEGSLYWKYSTNQRNGEFSDVNLGNKSDTIGVSTEPQDMGVLTFDEGKRLSSQFTVVDKNKTNDSSEGFYIYMFKEYSNGLRDSEIYMTVDLYHAGQGKKIPLYLPMTSDLSRPLTLYKENDLTTLKNGIPLNKYYEQLYIPLICRYDFTKKKHVYYLNDEYINKDYAPDDGTIIFNLFELKIGR